MIDNKQKILDLEKKIQQHKEDKIIIQKYSGFKGCHEVLQQIDILIKTSQYEIQKLLKENTSYELNSETSYYDELTADTTDYDSEWLPYTSNWF